MHIRRAVCDDFVYADVTMHARLLIGSYEWALGALPHSFQSENEDVRHYRGARMGIGEVREVIREAYLTPMTAPERTFIIAYSEITREAQNALLKLLEEPPRTAQFFLITERPGGLLPTLRSRLILDREEQAAPDHLHEAFLQLPYDARLKEIAARAKEKDDVWLASLMNYFGVWAHETRDAVFLRSYLELNTFFHTQGASKKMILEHLSLMLPVMKASR